MLLLQVREVFEQSAGSLIFLICRQEEQLDGPPESAPPEETPPDGEVLAIGSGEDTPPEDLPPAELPDTPSGGRPGAPPEDLIIDAAPSEAPSTPLPASSEPPEAPSTEEDRRFNPDLQTPASGSEPQIQSPQIKSPSLNRSLTIALDAPEEDTGYESMMARGHAANRAGDFDGAWQACNDCNDWDMLPLCCHMLSHAVTCHRVLPHAAACCRMLPHAPTCSHMLPHAPTCCGRSSARRTS